MIKAALTLALVAGLAGCAERPTVPEGQASAQSAAPQKRGGLFSVFARAPVFDAPEAYQMDVPFEATVPFGTVARVCEAKGKPLGTLASAAPGGGFQLYDTGPKGVALRKFYLTGFEDGCPRQFTAATAVFGTPSQYETLHYGQGKGGFIYGVTDAAYENIKENVCGTPAGEPCGRKIKKLDQSTVFVSAYDLSSDTERWTDFLIYNGKIVATALKTKEPLPADQ